INSPYLDRVIGAATAGYLLYSSRDLIAERLKYTLANYVTNEAAYLRGNFNEGGFSAWMSGTFTCGNDSFCALSSMEDQMQREIAAEVDAAANDYLAGGGLFSWRCNCPEPPAGAAAEGDAADANLSDANPSAGCSVCTPGSVLEGMLIEDANSPLHELQLADSFNEIIGALAMQMVNQVMGGGGLLGTSRPSGGGGRSYLEQVARESGAAGPRLVSGLLQTISSERQRVRSYKSAWQKIGEVAARALPICQLRGGTHLPEARYEVERSQKAIERADKAVQALDDLRVRLSSEMALPDGARTSVVQLIADDYNCLIQGGTPEDNDCKTETPIETGLDDVCPLSSATLPSAQESGCISGESTDTSGAPGATQTLYTRLKGYAEGGC
ncbi:MAG: hypothetical protein WBK28_01345, partial [Minisyncoccia bacterium]